MEGGYSGRGCKSGAPAAGAVAPKFVGIKSTLLGKVADKGLEIAIGDP